jgi:hypothetical protein
LQDGVKTVGQFASSIVRGYDNRDEGWRGRQGQSFKTPRRLTFKTAYLVEVLHAILLQVVPEFLPELDVDSVFQSACRHSPASEVELERAQRLAVQPDEYLSVGPVAERQLFDRPRQLNVQ